MIRGIPRRPPLVSLLNLTGLGLGYLYMYRWLRWLIHFLLTAGLVVTAFLTHAAYSPLRWAVILGLWLLWMVADGWLQARHLTCLALGWTPGRLWVPLAMGVFLLGAEVAGLWGYTAMGQREFELGMAAYEAAECPAAVRHFNRVTTIYQLTLSPDVIAADARVAECTQLLLAEDLRRQGQYADALTEYDDYLHDYPDSVLAVFVRRTIAEIYCEWATRMRQEGDSRAALEKYQIVLVEYADTPSYDQARIAVAAIYGEQAARLHAAGEFQSAIEAYELLLHEYPDTTPGAGAAETVAAIYDQWAALLRQAGDYQAAVEKYQALLQDYAGTFAGSRARAEIAKTYQVWATQLRGRGAYEEAIEKYQILVQEYPGTYTGSRGRLEIAATYQEWAIQLRGSGAYEEAIEKYQILVQEYPETYKGSRAGIEIAATYQEWAVQLRGAGAYEEAVEKYQIILHEYAETPAAVEARGAAAETYLEWAVQLRGAGAYEEAVEKYQMILHEYAETPAAVAAREAAAEAYLQWAVQLKEESSYPLALAKCDIILDEYTDTVAAATTPVIVGQIYNAWGGYLYGQHEYLAALDKYTLAQEATDDPGVLAAAETGYEETLWGLSQDRGDDGQQVMEQALEEVCAGLAATSPAVGMAEDEPGRVLLDGVWFSLPDDLEAIKPAHFRYAVCVETGTDVVESCPYTGGHTLVRRRRWWHVRVRATRTGEVIANHTFYGDLPADCPDERNFYDEVEYETGDPPSPVGVIEWLQDVL